MTANHSEEFAQVLARTIGPVLKRLYPQNPDVVLGREARIIAEAIAPAVMGVHDPTGADHMAEMWEHAQRADAAEALLRRALKNHDTIAAALRAGVATQRLGKAIDDMSDVKAEATALGAYPKPQMVLNSGGGA